MSGYLLKPALTRPSASDVVYGFKTHSGMLPQSRTLEALAADTLGRHETSQGLTPVYNRVEGRGRKPRNQSRKGKRLRWFTYWTNTADR